MLLPAVNRAWATCRCGAGSLEVVLVIDTTSSMQVMIGTVKAQLFKVMAALEGSAEKLRLGAVLFRSPGAGEYIVKSQPLTGDRSAVAKWISTARARGGGQEAVDLALEEALEKMGWSQGARKVIILVGDEAPAINRFQRCLKLARLAKGRGISVNTITCSMTAWTYWQLQNREAWEKMLRLQGQRAKETFRLPIFDNIAAAGGGMSISSKDSGELLAWLLAISRGAKKIRPKDILEFEDWDPGKQIKTAHKRPMLGQLRYKGGWDTPRNFEALRQALGARVSLDFDSGRKVLNPTSPDIRNFPLVYISGHGSITLSKVEKLALKKYLSNGGILWGDCCCGSKKFEKSFRLLARELLSKSPLKNIGSDHPLLRSGFVIGKVKKCRKPRSGQGGFDLKKPGLDVASIGNRLAIVLSRDSLGCGWASYPFGVACQIADEDALRLSINILLYALTAETRLDTVP